MILTGGQIVKEVKRGMITLSPFNTDQVNPNSYNYRLGKIIKVFSDFDGDRPHFKQIELPEEGFILEPGQMYLGNTLEEIGSKKYAMSLIGRSSLGRLGLFLQVSANLGHTNSSHQWTLELVASKALRIYPGMIIGQVSFWMNKGNCEPYEGFYGTCSEPTESNILQKTL